MDSEDIQTKLNSLNQAHPYRSVRERHVEIAYWFCQEGPGENELAIRTRIGRIMGYGETSIFNQIGEIQGKLGVSSLRHMPDDICRVLSENLSHLPIIDHELSVGSKREYLPEVVRGPDFTKLVWPPDQPEEEPEIPALANYLTALTALNENIEGFEAGTVENDDLLTSLSLAINAFEGLDTTTQADEAESFTQAKNRAVECMQAGQEEQSSEVSSDLARGFFSAAWLSQIRQRAGGFFDDFNLDRRARVGVAVILGIVIITFILINLIPNGDDETLQETVADGVSDSEQDVPPVITREIVVTTATDFAATNEVLQASVFALQQTLEAQPTVAPQVTVFEITTTTVPDTPGPTPTPLPPTHTPPPPATPTPLLVESFEDNFDGGPNDAWKVLSGNPIWSNNTLTTDGDSWLEIGDPNWTDYVVEFDAKTRHWLHRTNIMAVGVRANGKSNMVAFRWTDSGGDWYVVDSGDWSTINNTRTTGVGHEWTHYRITVKDNSFEVEVNGENFPPYYNTSYTNGNIILRYNYGQFDNFSIKPIEE